MYNKFIRSAAYKELSETVCDPEFNDFNGDFYNAATLDANFDPKMKMRTELHGIR